MNYSTLRIYRKKLFKAYECSLFEPNTHPARIETKESLYLTRTLDGEGRLLHLVRYFDNAEPRHERKLKYDDRGRIEEEEHIFHETGSVETVVYAYEPEEEVVQVLIGDEPVEETATRFHPNGKKKETEKLDSEGNVVAFSEWDAAENLIHHMDAKEEVFIEYLDEGRRKKVRHVSENGEELEIHTMDGKKPVKVEYWKDGEELGRDEYEYVGESHSEKRTFEANELVAKTVKKDNEAGQVLDFEEENFKDTVFGAKIHVRKQTQSYEYTPSGKVKRMRITATYFPNQGHKLRGNATVTRDGIMEIAYDAEDRQAEMLLSAYSEEHFESDSYYRYEYE